MGNRSEFRGHHTYLWNWGHHPCLWIPARFGSGLSAPERSAQRLLDRRKESLRPQGTSAPFLAAEFLDLVLSAEERVFPLGDGCGMPGATTRAIRAIAPAYSSPTLDQEFSMVSPEFQEFSMVSPEFS